MENTTERYNLDGYNPFVVAFDEITSEKAALWYRHQLIGAAVAAGARAKADSLVLWGWAIHTLVFVATGACRGTKGVASLAVGHVRSQYPETWGNTTAFVQRAAGLFSGSTETLPETAPVALSSAPETETPEDLPETGNNDSTPADFDEIGNNEALPIEPSVAHLESLGVRQLRDMAKSHGVTIPDANISRASKAQLVAALSPKPLQKTGA